MNKNSFGTLFKEAYRIYKTHIAKIIGLAAMICLPIQLLSWFAGYRLNNIDKIMDIMEQWESKVLTDESLYRALLQDAVGKYYIYVIVAGVIGVLGAVFSIAVIKMTMENVSFESVEEGDAARTIVYEENSAVLTGIGDYFSYAVKKLPKYAWTVLVGAVFAVGGFLLCFFPGIIALFISLFMVYTVALTPLWGAKAFRYTTAVLRFRPGLFLIYIGLAFVQQILLSAAVSIPGLFSFPAQAECIFFVVITSVLQVIFALFDILIALVFADTIRSVPALTKAAAESKKKDQSVL